MICNCAGVIFDFNGTLFFDGPKHALAWSRMAEDLRGTGLNQEELQAHFYGVPNNRAIEYLLGHSCPEAELTVHSEQKEAYYREFCRQDKESFHLVSGANEFFSQLQQEGIPFTIASASIKANIDFFVESFGLARWFDPEQIIYDDGRFSNKVDMFRCAAAAIGVPVEECLIFEDSESGIRDAFKAGCHNLIVVDSMGVAQKYAGQPGLVKIIQSFEDIL